MLLFLMFFDDNYLLLSCLACINLFSFLCIIVAVYLGKISALCVLGGPPLKPVYSTEWDMTFPLK